MILQKIAKLILKNELEELEQQIYDLKKRIEDLQKEEELGSPKITGKVTIEELANLFIKDLGIATTFSDRWYNTTSLEEAFKFVQATHVHLKKYEPEVYDCDNFSMALLGYWNQGLASFPFGYALGGRDMDQIHEFNIFVDDKKEVYIVEPQTGVFIPLKDAKNNKLYWPIQMVRI